MAPPLRKRIRRRIRAWLLRLAIALVGLLPLPVALWLGRGVGRLGHRLAGRERRLAATHLRQTFPDADDAFIENTTRAVFIGLGEHLFENMCVRAVDRRLPDYVRYDDSTRAVLEGALREGRGLVLVSGHIGNWELAGRALSQLGYDCVGVGRRSHDPGLEAIMERFRGSGGLDTVYRDEIETIRRLLAQFKNGGIVVLVVDQDTDVPSLFVPFLGRLAKTPRGPAELALRFRTPLLVGTIHRERPGGSHYFKVLRIPIEPTGNKERDTLELTTRINEVLSDDIRAHPEEWVWFHRRWRSQPETGQ